jgi:hypothetical protein
MPASGITSRSERTRRQFGIESPATGPRSRAAPCRPPPARGRPPIPMLTTVRISSPVCPAHSPSRTRFAEFAIRASTWWMSWATPCPSTSGPDERGSRRDTGSTARSSGARMRSPSNISSVRSRRPHTLGQRGDQPDRLLGQPVPLGQPASWRSRGTGHRCDRSACHRSRRRRRTALPGAGTEGWRVVGQRLHLLRLADPHATVGILPPTRTIPRGLTRPWRAHG